VQCTFVVNEVINYFNYRNSDVYAVLIDASKAFDKVNFYKLFNILVKRGVCPLVIRFLLGSYLNQQLCVKWKNSFSESFKVSNGVKQGGILSPILFTIYMDELLSRLSKSGYGCTICDVLVGALCYADDVVLPCPSRTSGFGENVIHMQAILHRVFYIL